MLNIILDGEVTETVPSFSESQFLTECYTAGLSPTSLSSSRLSRDSLCC